MRFTFLGPKPCQLGRYIGPTQKTMSSFGSFLVQYDLNTLIQKPIWVNVWSNTAIKMPLLGFIGVEEDENNHDFRSPQWLNKMKVSLEMNKKNEPKTSRNGLLCRNFLAKPHPPRRLGLGFLRLRPRNKSK